MTHIETWRLVVCLIAIGLSTFSLGMTLSNIINRAINSKENN